MVYASFQGCITSTQTPRCGPVIHGCRTIPVAVINRLKTTLQDLMKREVIAPVTEQTEWVSNLVVTEKKNGSLRVCLDPRELNEARANEALLHTHSR